MLDSNPAREELAAMDRQMQRQVEQARELQEAIGAVESKAFSKDRSIRVRVDSTGALTGLKLTEEALAKGPDTLAEEILKGCQAARSMLAGKMREVTDEVMGAGSETSELIASSYAERFGVPKKQDD